MTLDLRPVIMDGVHFGPALVTPFNPHGFNDADGRDISHRLDKPECVAAWRDIIARAVKANVQGIVWWQIAGLLPGRPQYVVEPHLIPPDILPQFVAITALTKAAGLWTGCLLRPADLSLRTGWDEETCFAFDELSADVRRILTERLDAMRRYGVDRGYYLDSFGLNDADAATAAWLRGQVGPDVPLYCEACSDRLNRYCGAFAFAPEGTGWLTYGPQLDVSCVGCDPDGPKMPIIGLDGSWRPLPDRIAWAASHGVAPIVMAYELPMPPDPHPAITEGRQERVRQTQREVNDLMRRHLTRYVGRDAERGLTGIDYADAIRARAEK
jgi:hypothetical protein